MKITVSTQIIVGYNTKAGELAEFFSAIPSDARVSINKTADYGPRDPSVTTIKATWTEDRGSKDPGVTAWRDR